MTIAMDSRQRLESFVLREASLLDRGRFDEWLDLFSEDAIYWLPIDIDSRSPRTGLNLVFDDRARLGDRVRRLRSGLSHTEDPPSRSVRLVGSLRMLGPDERHAVADNIDIYEKDAVVEVPYAITRARPDSVRTFNARASFVLRLEGDDYRIRIKRVDLAEAHLPLPPLTFIL